MRQGSFQGRPQNRNNNNNNRHRGPQNNGGTRQYSNNSSNGGRPHRNQVLDSNGPDVRVRGTAFQINEKYMSLAKDASSMGDLILAENYLQHAEHYQRMINEFEPQQTQPLQQPQFENNQHADDGQIPQPTQSDEGTVTSTKPMAQSDDSTDADGVRVVRRAPRPRRAPVSDDDGDLGLPTSILGGDAVGA